MLFCTYVYIHSRVEVRTISYFLEKEGCKVADWVALRMQFLLKLCLNTIFHLSLCPYINGM